MSIQQWFRTISTLSLAWGAFTSGASARGDDPQPPPSPGVVASGSSLAKALAEAWPDRPEWLDMYTDILQGSQLGPNDGWFRRALAQTRFGWEATRKRFDGDGDGRIARQEFPGTDADFARLDRDHDKALTKTDFDFSQHALTMSPGAMLFMRADRDGNGKVTRDEIDDFFNQCDSGNQEFLSLSDLQDAFRMPAARPVQSGARSGPSPETLIRGLFHQEIGSLQPGPALGESAPDFALKTVDGKEELTLSKLIGPRPVVLVFGNFTCGPFRAQAGNVEKLYRMYKDRATFLMIYVREAHPTDGWSMESNDRVGVSLAQPRSYEERVSVAETCGKRLGLGFPMLVDKIDDAVGARYSGMPSRLYLIDRQNKIAYKSGRGPFGFKPAELEHSLVLLLQEGTKSAGDHQARVSLLDDADAWRRLPRAKLGAGQPLPTWARALARALPRTTAAMLELDRLHRTQSPLGPALRGKMRWIAADANRCAYARVYAEADLRRAGVNEADICALAGDHSGLPEPERAALNFARQMTLEADKVTDAEVEYLKSAYDEKKLAAMVLLLAYANFQDRLLLALDVPVEPAGPLPALEVRFDNEKPAPPVPARNRPANRSAPPVPERVDDSDWLAFNIDDLKDFLETQKSYVGRIRVPAFDEVLKGLPASYPAPKNPIRIKWSLVCMGYQPELAIAWSACTRAFGEEAKQDRVFEESLFWVVTRTIHCFY
jgi:alkylhydroperoxidase family enzyme/thiol-disulfide isomerase/thioredoxin